MYNIIELAKLMDQYGALLTERQREIMSSYVYEDLSLYEISEIKGISRQGVRDCIVHASLLLDNYEKLLHLVEKNAVIHQAAEKIGIICNNNQDIKEEVNKIIGALI